MEWMKQTWALLTSWAVTVVAVTQAVRATYAAEHDRQALKQVELKREKLALEVEHLQNRPKIVKERREIYDRLRGTLGEITRDGKVSIPQINVLHGVRHDAEFRFPSDVVERIVSLIDEVVNFDVTKRVLEYSIVLTPEGRKKQVDINHEAAMAMLKFEADMVDIFRPHLKL